MPSQQPVTHVGDRDPQDPRDLREGLGPHGRGATRAAPPCRHDPHQSGGPGDENHGGHGGSDRLQSRRQQQHGAQRQPEEDDLTGRALPHDGPHAAADVAAVTPVSDASVHVAEHTAGQGHVEELRPVARGDRRAQGQLGPEAAGHEDPPPRAADGRDHGDGGRRRDRTGVDVAQSVDEGATTDAPHEDAEDHEPREGAQPGPVALHLLRPFCPGSAEYPPGTLMVTTSGSTIGFSDPLPARARPTRALRSPTTMTGCRVAPGHSCAAVPAGPRR